MRILTRIALAAAAAAFALSAGAASAQDKVLKIGTEGAYPPFNNLTADGKLEGFDIDIANALCDEMKVKCEFVTQDWDGIIPALQAGKFDAIIASMSITPERAEKVDFTNKYYNTPPAIAAPKDSDIKGVTKEDLAGKTIGVATSTTHFNYSTKTYTDSTIKGYPSSQEFMLDLANGRLDAVNDDISVLEGWLATPDGACCKLIGAVTPVPEIHGPGAGIAVRKGETELVKQVQRRDRRHPRQRQVQGNQRQVLQVRRLRRRFLIDAIEAAARPARRRACHWQPPLGIQARTDAERLDASQLGAGGLAGRPRLWRLRHRLAGRSPPCRSAWSIGFFVALAKQSQRAVAAPCGQHLHHHLPRPAGAADAVPRLFRRPDRRCRA